MTAPTTSSLLSPVQVLDPRMLLDTLDLNCPESPSPSSSLEREARQCLLKRSAPWDVLLLTLLIDSSTRLVSRLRSSSTGHNKCSKRCAGGGGITSLSLCSLAPKESCRHPASVHRVSMQVSLAWQGQAAAATATLGWPSHPTTRQSTLLRQDLWGQP